jgi:hypothetical protein
MTDLRRQKSINAEPSFGNDDCIRLTIDGELWAAVEWSKKRQAWCIEDAEGRCLSHVSHIRGQASSKDEAVALAETMIRDGRMPSPEDAKEQRRARLEKQRNRPSAVRQREQREQHRKEESRLFWTEWEARAHDAAEPPLYEVIADAFDLTDPELWKRNSFAMLRSRLIVSLNKEIAKLELLEAHERHRPPKWSRQPERKQRLLQWRKAEQEKIERKLARAQEILRLLQGAAP